MIAITIITLSCTWYYHSIKPILVGICVRGASSDPCKRFSQQNAIGWQFWLWFGTRTFLRVRRQQDAFFKKHPEAMFLTSTPIPNAALLGT